MEAKELRIGNYINFNGVDIQCGYAVITDIRQKEKGLTNEYLSTIIYKPILLTEEWLLKFGFSGDKEYGWSFNYVLIITNGEHFDYWGADNVIDLRYIHQLQNLYFALTGEELTTNK